MSRTWTKVGRSVYRHVGTDGERPTVESDEGQRRIEAAIGRLIWIDAEGAFPLVPAVGVQRAIDGLHLPRVSAIAISDELAPYGLYGIEANYPDGRARVYVIDRGGDLVAVASDFPMDVEEAAA